MTDYLLDGWPLGPTSTVYMDATALFNVRMRGKVGILATVRLSQDQAQMIRDVVSEAIQTTENTTIERLVREWDDGGLLDAVMHNLTFEEWVRRRANSVPISVVEDE
jgi:hypothetical protein